MKSALIALSAAFMIISNIPISRAMHNCATEPSKMRVVEPGTEVTLWKGHNYEGFIYVHLQTDDGLGSGVFRIFDVAKGQTIETIAAAEFAAIGVSAPPTGLELRVEFRKKTLCIPCSKVTDHKSSDEVRRQWSGPDVLACGTNENCVRGIFSTIRDSHDSIFWP